MQQTATQVYWITLTHGPSTFYLAATEHGLCRVTLPNESFIALTAWIDKHIPHATLVESIDKMAVYRQQVAEYLQGDRKEFTCPLDFRGTPFQIGVWQQLTRIPYGATASYSEIAAAVARPAAIRAVGAANGANPIPIVVPCHRVIGKNGTLTGYRGGLALKEQLLQLEGSIDVLHQ